MADEGCISSLTISDVNINSEKLYFMVAAREGAQQYRANPIKLFNHIREYGSMKTAVQLDSSFVGLLVPDEPGNEAMLFNMTHHTEKAVITVEHPIISALITDFMIILVCENLVSTYDINLFPEVEIEPSTEYPSGVNPLGLCETTSAVMAHRILVFPGKQTGSVEIWRVDGKNKENNSGKIIRAHKHTLQSLRLSHSGNILATASQTGTIIRLWNTSDLTQIMEMRRGKEPATIYHMDMSADEHFLCCVSSKGTGHIFALKDRELNNPSNIGDGDCTSMNTFHVPEVSPCKLGMGVDGSIIVVTKDGRYFKFQFPRDEPNLPVQLVEFYIYCKLAVVHRGMVKEYALNKTEETPPMAYSSYKGRRLQPDQRRD